MPQPKKFRESLPTALQILRYFWPEIRKHRALITGSLMALFVEIGLRLLEPWPLKFVFDRVIGVRHSAKPSFFSSINALDPMTLLTIAAVIAVAITGLRALAGFWNTIGFAKIGNRVLAQVRTRLYRHLQYLSLSFHTKAKTGDLVVRVVSDVGMLQDVVVTAVLPMLAKTLVFCGMVALMFWLNWRLTLIALLVLPFFWLRTVTLSPQIQEVARKQRKREGAMAAMAAETMSAIKTVQALSLAGIFDVAFSKQSTRSWKQDVKARRLAASLERSIDVLTAVAGSLVLWYGTRLVLRDKLSPGDLLVFLAYLKNTFRPIQDFAKFTARLGKATAAGERVLDLLLRVPDVRDLPGAVPAPSFRGEVRFEDVSFAYELHQSLLQGINLEVKPGQKVDLVGPSGSGKSTLVSLILRLYDPQDGRVIIDGHDIREFTLESLRGQTSVVLQDNLLFATSVRENIGCGAPSVTIDEIRVAARIANADEFISALPQGYDTVLGERGVTLSHGQRQRLAIARAIIRKAPILILDEPTTGLDTENEHEVLAALEKLYGDRTTFLITHNLQHATSADLILYLERGRLLERGTHEALMRANGRYATLYSIQTAPKGGVLQFEASSTGLRNHGGISRPGAINE